MVEFWWTMIPIPSDRCLLGKQALESFLLRALILREKCRHQAHGSCIQEGLEKPETHGLALDPSKLMGPAFGKA